MLMLIWVIPVLLIPAALVGSPTMVNAAAGSQICVNPSGLTRIIGANEKCRPSERLVPWDTSGSQGGTLTVIDSLGNTVGPLIRPDAVALTVGGNRFLIGVGTDGFRNITGLSLYYESTGCSGVALIQPSTNMLLPLLLVAGTTGYYGGSQSQVYSVVYRTSYNPDRRVFEGCFLSFPGPLTPAKTVNLNPLFTPPFSIK
jgi:hypothetical protein